MSTTVERRWNRAIKELIDYKLVKLLISLDVLSTKTCNEYQTRSHQRLIELRKPRADRRGGDSIFNGIRYNPVKEIKPTKARR